MNIKYFLGLTVSLVVCYSANAQSYSYTTINNSNKEAYIKHWKISDEEYKRYVDFMAVEGRYRYKDLTPLEVLGISAKDNAAKHYYAKKAAKTERDAVQKQIEFALLITQYKNQLAEEEKSKEEVSKKESKLDKIIRKSQKGEK